MLAAVGPVQIIVVLLYVLAIAYLGWRGFRKTRSATDYLLAGRQTHPFVMALSYGATFISTSAIVGFGGVAGMFGMSLMWLTFLNIFVGIFILVMIGVVYTVGSLSNVYFRQVDPILVALPISLAVFAAVSALSRPVRSDHLARCFQNRTT